MNFVINQEIDLLTFISGSLATIGGFFLVRSILGSSARQLASLSGTYIGSNPHLQRSLVEQKADTLFGFAFVLVSGIFWIGCAFFRLSIAATPKAYISLFLFDAFLFLICWFFARKYRLNLGQRTNLIDFMRHVQSSAKYPSQFDASKLCDEAKRRGLDHFFGGAADPFDCLKKCAIAAGASGGAEIIEDIRKKKQSSP